MSKRTIFTNITPLAPQISRQIVIDMLHDHDGMIELNPLVIDHHPIAPPKDAPAEEFAKCVWQQLTDRVQYLPGGLMNGKVSYNASFYDLPLGIQTHIYAPLGLEIKGKWSVGGNMPGEPRVKSELGVKVPAEGLYLREDVDMKCNILMTGFVKKTLQKAHEVLVARLLARSEYVESVVHEQRFSTVSTAQYQGPRTYSSSGSHASSSPQVVGEEWKKQQPLLNMHPVHTQVSQPIHELPQEMTPTEPAELYSDHGFSEPTVGRYQSQRNANPYER